MLRTRWVSTAIAGVLAVAGLWAMPGAVSADERAAPNSAVMTDNQSNLAAARLVDHRWDRLRPGEVRVYVDPYPDAGVYYVPPRTYWYGPYCGPYYYEYRYEGPWIVAPRGHWEWDDGRWGWDDD